MPTAPRLSFIVLCFNYAHYIGQCIRSILDQTVQDFEIVVIDDASTDDSVAVIRAFNDPRIRLFCNEVNRGGAWSYNRAISLAEAEFLVNLDADDWIVPEKCERQLLAFAEDPTLDIVGSFIVAVDGAGERHRNHEQIEAHCNRTLDLNVVGTWIVQNPLCRSSVMMRRDAHLRIGLDDATMFYTCDWELWTRALKEGCRFLVLPEPLTCYRWHGSNITFKNPSILFLETVYLMRRNVVPTIEQRASYLGFGRMLTWIVENEEFAKLQVGMRYRLLASLLTASRDDDFAAYHARLLSPGIDPEAERLGKLCLALARYGPSRIPELTYWRDCHFAEDVKNNWFLPRIAHLEAIVADHERTKQEWFEPHIAALEGWIANLEREKKEWFIPQLATLEARIAKLEQEKAEQLMPEIARLRSRLAQDEESTAT